MQFKIGDRVKQISCTNGNKTIDYLESSHWVEKDYILGMMKGVHTISKMSPSGAVLYFCKDERTYHDGYAHDFVLARKRTLVKKIL